MKINDFFIYTWLASAAKAVIVAGGYVPLRTLMTIINADVVKADAATHNLRRKVSDKHASTNLADMDTIDYVSLLMEQEHR